MTQRDASPLPGWCRRARQAVLRLCPRVRPSRTLPEEVLSAYSYMPATLAGHLAGIAVVTFLFWRLAPWSVLLPWLCIFSVMWCTRLAMKLRFKHIVLSHTDEWLRWRLYWNLGSLAAGALWGLTAWVFYPLGGGIQQTGLIVIVYTFSVVVVPVLATQPRMYLGFVCLCFVPLIARIAMEGDIYSYELAGILLLILSMTVLLARNYRQALERVLEHKERVDELLVQLRVEKQAAEDARRVAEVANRAKTQFFTAASHDLRQPLHAMGLFAEALRQKTHDGEVAQLVNSIYSSVDALDGLFCELLDISRLDTGVVPVSPRHFEVRDIFRKLRLNFEPMAFEKGLSLRLRGDRQMVFADPLLVERILRNLLSNAIRYTTDGSVLVSARSRGGQVLLQVWDTGMGIAPAEQKRIFEEFYQVPRVQAETEEQRKGLGLGLSIVQRLSHLMHAPLDMQSRSGHGTVFSLMLPAGQRLPSAPVQIPPLSHLGITLDERVILIVEDETAVLSGLEVLLRGWGASVLPFDSLRAVTAWLDEAGAAARCPDLLIVDYRLEHGANGIQVLQLLRERLPNRVPAIVVTGSSMLHQEKEALEHDFHLLIKPVVPNKLRAMIGFKLGLKARSGAAALVHSA
jgi:signal transduction histidine kinase